MLCFCVTLWRPASATLTIFLCWTVALNEISMKMGRKQARAIGFSINKSGVRFNEIISSDWCRCKETAELLNIGKWQTFLGLNSFFQAHAERAVTLRELDLKLKKLKNGVTLMITHQVVISAVTGISVTSGEMVAYNSVSEAKKVFRLDK